MKDQRGYEIKKLLKSNYPTAKFSVRLSKYSMGESIWVMTDLIKREKIELNTGGYTFGYSEATINKSREIKEMLKNYEEVDRDQWGEILSGGNTFLFVEPLN